MEGKAYWDAIKRNANVAIIDKRKLIIEANCLLTERDISSLCQQAVGLYNQLSFVNNGNICISFKGKHWQKKINSVPSR